MTDQNKNPNVIVYGDCATHGRYPSIFRNQLGEVVAYGGCPICLREAKQRDIFKSASIPKRFLTKTLDGYTPVNDSQRAAKAFVEDFNTNIATYLEAGLSAIFWGDHGLGKSHLAVCAVRKAIEEGYTAKFESVIGMIKSIRETWAEGGAAERRMVRAYQEIDLLVLDEVGVQKMSDSELETMTEVIVGRYNNVKSTIICSNLTLQEICDVLSPRNFDRLRENGGRAIHFHGDSMRRTV